MFTLSSENATGSRRRVPAVAAIVLVVFRGMLPIEASGQEETTSIGATETGGIEDSREVGLYDDNRWGVIFNTGDISLDLESYQGGVGLKWLRRRWGIRGVLDLFYSNDSDTFSSLFGATAEYHLAPGRVSPYVGAYLSSGVTTQRTEIDDDNWTEFVTSPTAGGGILGAEVWVFDFLSAFVEYSLGAELIFNRTTESVAGDETEEKDWEYILGTRLGNAGRIGIVIYFPPRPPEGYFGRRQEDEPDADK